jgi:hypothetical protein
MASSGGNPIENAWQRTPHKDLGQRRVGLLELDLLLLVGLVVAGRRRLSLRRLLLLGQAVRRLRMTVLRRARLLTHFGCNGLRSKVEIRAEGRVGMVVSMRVQDRREGEEVPKNSSLI